MTCEPLGEHLVRWTSSLRSIHTKIANGLYILTQSERGLKPLLIIIAIGSKHIAIEADAHLRYIVKAIAQRHIRQSDLSDIKAIGFSEVKDRA